MLVAPFDSGSTGPARATVAQACWTSDECSAVTADGWRELGLLAAPDRRPAQLFPGAAHEHGLCS
jgi:hypothetical protein